MLIRNEDGVRWIPLGAVLAALAFAGVLAYQRWWPHDSVTEITLDQVLDRYRDEVAERGGTPPPAGAQVVVGVTTSVAPPSTGAVRPGPPPATLTAVATSVPTTQAPEPTAPEPQLVLPAPGVYQYATEGREHVTALGGTEHRYPATTTITVTPAGCGVHLRWDLLAERYEEWSLCLADGAIVLQPDGVQFHEFYGQQQTDAATCLGAVPLNPPPPAGAAIDRDCRLAGEPWHPVWVAGLPGSLLVAGATVATTAFDVTIELAGDYPERSTQHWEFAPNGLPVSIAWRMESANPSPVGDVTYTEQVDATLLALDPLG